MNTKVCINPDCPSYQEDRHFPASDQICPRCGDPLVDAGVAGRPGPYVAYAATARQRASATLSSEYAFAGAVGTLLLAGLIVLVLLSLGMRSGMIGPGSGLVVGALPGAGAPPVLLPTAGAAVPPLALTQVAGTAVAQATAAARPTPVDGLLNPAAAVTAATIPVQSMALPTPTIPPGLGGNGTDNPGALPGGLPGATPLGSNILAVGLCERIAPGQPCVARTSYGTNATFYIAVEANFGPGAVQSVRLRLFGPPAGERPLLSQDQANVPGRDGRFWVGFAFSQDHPWAPGIYRADLFINGETQRTTFLTWTVQ